MDNDSISNLKFDSRMARRRGWVSDEERDAYLAALPDTAEKLEVVADVAPPGAQGEERGDA
ncbi:MAG: hypothetical protein R3E88_04610 [Myxococcota bacterium]|nr:hypothetical protein [Myxococcales bacterium]